MAYQKLSRKSGPRKALLRSQVTALLKHGQIKTTAAKAKAIQPVAEKMITLGKRGGLHARRQALAYLYDENVVAELFERISPTFGDREGGYTRITPLGPRRGDSAPMVIIELVS